VNNDAREVIRILDWQIPQQGSIHQAENRRIGANAEG